MTTSTKPAKKPAKKQAKNESTEDPRFDDIRAILAEYDEVPSETALVKRIRRAIGD